MGLKQSLWVNMVWALVLLLSSVAAADLEHDLHPFKTQMGRLLAINDDLEARVTALESQMTALQSLVTAQQSEVVAVQKEVASVDTHLVQVDDSLTNLTSRYNATVDLVQVMESSITTTITRVNQTEVRVSLVEEGVTSVNRTTKNNAASLLELAMAITGTNKQLGLTTGLANETAIGLDLVNGTLSRVATRLDTVNSTAETNVEGLAEVGKVIAVTTKQLAFTTGLANETAKGLDMANATLVQVKQLVQMHGKVIATANEAIKKINNKELPDVKESVEENHEMVKKNEKELEEDASLVSDNKVAIVDNSKGIEHAERSINNLGKALNVVTRKVKANRKTASVNEESIKGINKEMTYVKTQVVEFCGYQSSWGEEDKSVTYEYLTVSKNTASESNSDGFSQGQGQGHLPTPRPTLSRPPHHKLPGLNTKTGLFIAPMSGTYRVSFQVGHLETPDTNGEHKTSIFVRKNGLKDESLHMETKSHSEETNVIAHEALVKMSKEDTLDVFVDETKDDMYGILFCIALV